MSEKITTEEFTEKIFDFKNEKEWKFLGDKPAIIDFYADWCGPCKMISPILDEISKEYSDKLNVYKIDTDAEQELAMSFGIQSIPAIFFIPMEGKPLSAMGALPKEGILKAMKDVMGVE